MLNVMLPRLLRWFVASATPFRFAAVALTFAATALPHASFAADAEAALAKPRLVVLTDISNEPDDEESLVRLLVYSNEFDLEGIIATTSVWLKTNTRPDLILRGIDAYAQVRDHLLQHAPGFPPADELRAGVKSSCPVLGLAGVGEGKDTEGSNWIIKVVDRAEERPVWVTIWGGANCLAQALSDVKRTRTPAELEAFVAKLRVYSISDQDDAGPWIRRTFPGVYYIVSPSTPNGDEYYLATWTGISGDRRYQNGPMEHFELVDNPWLTEHIRENHGPLGALYPKLAYIMEGDTPSFLNLIGNGLAGDTNPTWGGWGGRYALRQSYGETRPIWTNARDTVRLTSGQDYTSAQATIWRWREAYQHDFAARMDWCVKDPGHANHNPIAVVNGAAGKAPLHLSVKGGEQVKLSAEGSRDPDGNGLAYRWFVYPEAGAPRRLPPAVAIAGADTPAATVAVPAALATPLHVILEVRDDGIPALFSYRRIILDPAARPAK